MITIVSKGNWKNYYGLLDDKVFEVVKVGGRFYQAKFKHNELTAVWDAFTKNEFILVEKENEGEI